MEIFVEKGVGRELNNPSAREGKFEIIGTADTIVRLSRRGLRIQARVFRPGFEIPARYAEVYARHSERAIHPGLCETVGNRDLAQLDIAAVFHARLVDASEGARRQIAVAIPVLTDRDLSTRTRPYDRSGKPPCIAERVQVAGASGVGWTGTNCPALRVEIRTITPQRALGAVPHYSTFLDIEKSGKRELADPERAMNI